MHTTYSRKVQYVATHKDVFSQDTIKISSDVRKYVAIYVHAGV